MTTDAPATSETPAPSPSRTRGGFGGGRGGRTRTRNRFGGGGQATGAPDTNKNIVSSAPPSAPEASATTPPDLGDIGGGAGRELEVTQPADDDTPTPVTSIEDADPAATTVATEGPSAPSITAIPVNSGDLGGAAPPVLDSGKKDRPFCVGKNTFANAGAAVQRACDVQFNRCADAANADELDGKTVADCEAQKATCGR